jgi:hypothetical protein
MPSGDHIRAIHGSIIRSRPDHPAAQACVFDP